MIVEPMTPVGKGSFVALILSSMVRVSVTGITNEVSTRKPISILSIKFAVYRIEREPKTIDSGPQLCQGRTLSKRHG